MTVGGLPESANRVLDLAADSFDEGERPDKPLSAAFMRGGFTPLQVRQALALAKRTVKPGQEPAAFVQSKSGSALVVMEADALESLLGILAQRADRLVNPATHGCSKPDGNAPPNDG